MAITIMKKCSINYTFIVLMLFAILLGLSNEFFLILFGLIFHEIGHLIFIKLFEYKINKITLYPFGGVIVYENKNDFIFKSILICLGGILSNFLLFMLFKFFNLYSLSNVNLLLLLINLLPIFPLDGGRILVLVLSLFIPYKLSKKFVHYLSIVFVILLAIYLSMYLNGIYWYLLLAFFIKSNISSLIFLKKDYQFFLLMKHLNPNDKLSCKETRFWCKNPIESIFMGKYMVYDFNTFKIEEKKILKKYFENKKRL